MGLNVIIGPEGVNRHRHSFRLWQQAMAVYTAGLVPGAENQSMIAGLGQLPVGPPIGSKTVKVLPCPGDDWTLMRPP